MNQKIVVIVSLLFSYIQSEEIVSCTMNLQEHFLKQNYDSKQDIKKIKTLFKNNIKRVVVISPFCVTGGPENLCQIYKELKMQGFETYMYWLDNYYTFVKTYKNGQWYLSGSDMEKTPEFYKKNYDVNYLDYEILLDQKTLIILPEIWCDAINFFEDAYVAIAWLSINHLHGVGKSGICSLLIDQKRLNDLNCLHLAQAPWIQKTLKNWGAESFLLGDYISECYLEKSMENKINNSIAYYPKKGVEFSTTFIEKYPCFNYIRLEGLDQLGMIQALDQAKIYIDFGTFPGKDRIPREALLRNSVIFIRNIGCATDYDSFPIDDYFRFSEQDILDGTLYKKVNDVLADYENMKQKQNCMRDQVLQEYEIFKNAIIEFFGIPGK